MAEQPPVLDTPWQSVNPLVDLAPGTVTTVASLVTVGKSMFAQNIATRTALHHRAGTAFCTAEVSNQDMMARILAEHTDIDSAKIRHMELDESQDQTIRAAAEQFSAAPLVLSDPLGKGADLQQVTDAVLKLRQQNVVPRLVVVDSLQTFVDPADADALEAAMDRLRAIAGEYRLAVLLVAFTDRANPGDAQSDEVPGVALEGSDVVLMLHRETGYFGGDVEPSMNTTVRAVKGPGMGREARLVLEPQYARFVEAGITA